MSIDAMKQALEALYNMVEDGDETDKRQAIAAITALHLAIEQAERVKRAEEAFAAASEEMKGEQAERQEPVAWCQLTPSGQIAFFDGKPMVMVSTVGNEHHMTPLYTAPPQRQPLTEEQVYEALPHRDRSEIDFVIVRAIERKHGIGGEE